MARSLDDSRPYVRSNHWVQRICTYVLITVRGCPPVYFTQWLVITIVRCRIGESMHQLLKLLNILIKDRVKLINKLFRFRNKLWFCTDFEISVKRLSKNGNYQHHNLFLNWNNWLMSFTRSLIKTFNSIIKSLYRFLQ